MAEEIIKALEGEELQAKIDAVENLQSVPANQIEQVFKKISSDLNSEIRYAAVSQIELCPQSFQTFIHDIDPKIRSFVIQKSVDIRIALKNDSEMISALSKFVTDTSTEVRIALASVISQHSKLFTDDHGVKTVQETLVPLLEGLLADKCDDVRVVASQNIKELAFQFGYDFVIEQLYTCLHHMLSDLQWRVRNSAIEMLFNLALACNLDFFEANLFQFLIQFLQDPSYNVRDFAISHLPSLVIHFGLEWLNSTLIKSLSELANSSNFLYRQVYLKSITILVNLFPVQFRSNYVFQPLIHFLGDPVDNVVLTSLNCITQNLRLIHPFKVQNELIPVLESLEINRSKTICEESSHLLQKIKLSNK